LPDWGPASAPKFSRTLIAAGGFTGKSVAAIVAAGDADLVAFGRHFTSSPDVPERPRGGGLPLNRYDRSTFYGGYLMHIETSALSVG
jgi:N-ethylmaleimide reductase